MADFLKKKETARKDLHKKDFSEDDARRKREDHVVKIRKNKREERLAKKRMVY